jgi:hypothetical protein
MKIQNLTKDLTSREQEPRFTKPKPAARRRTYEKIENTMWYQNSETDLMPERNRRAGNGFLPQAMGTKNQNSRQNYIKQHQIKNGKKHMAQTRSKNNIFILIQSTITTDL